MCVCVHTWICNAAENKDGIVLNSLSEGHTLLKGPSFREFTLQQGERLKNVKWLELLSAIQKAGSQKYELTAANRPAFHVERGKVSDLKSSLKSNNKTYWNQEKDYNGALKITVTVYFCFIF